MTPTDKNGTRPPQAIYFPAITWDYYLKNDPKCGIGIVARRNIKKGEKIFDDSIEFMFRDVAEGDYLLLQGHRKASKKSGTDVPATFPLTREVLLLTHGVPGLVKEDPTGKTAGLIHWRLESPHMLMNHSCEPTCVDDSHDTCRGEGYASRNIKKGEELTYFYPLQYYDRGPFFDKCLCGTPSCLGSMMGFKALSDADKAKYLSKVSLLDFFYFLLYSCIYQETRKTYVQTFNVFQCNNSSILYSAGQRSSSSHAQG